MRTRASAGLLASLTALSSVAGCSGVSYESKPITNVTIPIKDTTPKPPPRGREPPPESGPVRDVSFPKVAWTELTNGLRIGAIENHALPLVQVRLVVFGGRAADGERPGLTGITGQMLKEGGAGAFTSRDLIAKVDSIGAQLSISTGFDSTVLAISATKDRLGEVIGLIAKMAGEPRFSESEFTKLKQRTVAEAQDLARTSGRWTSMMVLYRDLFSLPSEHHPYASFGATAAEMEKITIADCRALHKKLYVAKNSLVVVAGDVTPAEVKAASEKSLSSYRPGDAVPISFVDPNAPESVKITIVDRPKAQQSDVFVGMLGPERHDKSWAAFVVANHLLGGGPASRLFLDVREKQSLAYRTGSTLTELSHGRNVEVASASTKTSETGKALKALLDDIDALARSAPSDEEVGDASRYLSDVFGIRMESVGALADQLVKNKTLGLADDYDNGYRKEIREMTAPVVSHAAGELFRSGHEIIVVAGDASKIEGPLSHFGDVKVLDPTKDFARERTVPMNANAPLTAAEESPKAAGGDSAGDRGRVSAK